ncbi:MAG: hypothetical protein IJD53_01910 [Alistipes sp.]|nr:hypothetical protein [Alistipes sp.]
MKLKYFMLPTMVLSLAVVGCGGEKPKQEEQQAEQTAIAATEEQTESEKLFELGNMDLVVPLYIDENVKEHYLTDYYPQWVGADKITTDDERIELTPLKDDWSVFSIKASKDMKVSTIDVWHGESKLSIVVLGGNRDKDSYMTVVGTFDNDILANKDITEAVVMWQNKRIEGVDVEGKYIFLNTPDEAKDYKRSHLRIFAASKDGRFNDVLIPLENGSPVTSTSQLARSDKHTQVLYSLMIDRFANGSTANDWKLNSPEVLDKVDYQGGDIVGITQKIQDSYFDMLGISTIWISPITQNPYDAWGQNVNPDTKFSGYHGYWPIYSTVVDKRFGTEEELRTMLNEAHANGKNVILDYVANHLHINSPVLQEHPDWTTELMLPDGRKNIGQWDGETRLTTWFDEHIPTLDLERQEVCDPMTDSALHWVRNFDFDGYRHDACKHIPLDYWRMLTHKMKSEMPNRSLWQIGETYGDVSLIGSYVKTGMIDAQFDFNLYHTSRDVIVDESRSMRDIVAVVEESEAAYGSHHTMGNITGNHDKPRFISLAGGDMSLWCPDDKAEGWNREVGVGDMDMGHAKLKLLKAIISTVPGVPCIYQGDEYGVPGANDPDNRDMMVFEAANDHQQKEFEATCNLFNLRRSSLALMYGNYKTLYVDDSVWVFMRHYKDDLAIVAMNVRDKDRTVRVKLDNLIFGVLNRSLRKSLGSYDADVVRDQDYSLTIHIPAYGYAIFQKRL